MADQWHGGQASSGERWNVNLPAVVGVVFVFLIGVVIWVVASSGDDGGDAIQSVDTGVTTAPTVAPVTTPPPTTTPPPMPSTTPAPGVTSAPAPTVASTAPPATPAPTQPPATQPPDTTTTTSSTVAPTSSTTTTSTIPPPDGAGDLGVEGHPIRRPACDGSYITVIASAVGDDATPAGLGIVLDQYDGSSYLRTDLTCPSLTQSVEGEPVYVVYFGPFNRDSQACAARDDGPEGAYVRRLSRDLDPTHTVACD